MELDHQETDPEGDYDRVRKECCSQGCWRIQEMKKVRETSKPNK